MNEVTMRSVLTVHCSGFSRRDLHKYSTILDARLLSQMPRRYLNKINNIVQNSSQTSMTAAADELHLKVDAIHLLFQTVSTSQSLSTVPEIHAAFIITLVSDQLYQQTSDRLRSHKSSVRSVRDGARNASRTTPRNTNSGTKPTSPTASRTTANQINLWNLTPPKSFGPVQPRNIDIATQLSFLMETRKPTDKLSASTPTKMFLSTMRSASLTSLSA